MKKSIESKQYNDRMTTLHAFLTFFNENTQPVVRKTKN